MELDLIYVTVYILSKVNFSLNFCNQGGKPRIEITKNLKNLCLAKISKKKIPLDNLKIYVVSEFYSNRIKIVASSSANNNNKQTLGTP